MAAAQKNKASDRQAVCKRLLTNLKKRYTGKLPKFDKPVLETMLFSASLENSTWEQAEAAQERLHANFHDLNEIRVSSVKEAESVFSDLSHPDWRALRVRSVLQFVFEDTYSFEYDALKRKTLDSANKQLSKVSHMTSFMRLFTLQHALGSHLLPVDDRMSNALIWLGLAAPKTSTEDVSNILKSSVRKVDSPLFCHLVRCLVTDPKYSKFFETINKHAPAEGWDLESGVERLDRLFKRGPSAFQKPKKKRETAKPSSKTSKSVKKTTKKTTTKKTTAHGTATKTAKKKSTSSAKTKKSAASVPRKKAGVKKVKVAKPKATKKVSRKAKSVKKTTTRKKPTR